MIVRTDPGLGELGFSLKPPKAIRNAVSGAVNAVKSLFGSNAVKVSVPTPAGPVEVNRNTVQNVVDQARRATVTIGPRESVRPASVTDFVQANVPGGFGGVAIGAGLLALLLLSRRGRSR